MYAVSDLLLGAHVIAGTLGLLLGPLTLLARSQRQRATQRGYHAAVVVVAVSGTGLVALDPIALWWLLPLAALTYGCLWAGLHARPGRHRTCLHGLGGSYIALVSALLVVSIDGPAGPVACALPTLLGFIAI